MRFEFSTLEGAVCIRVRRAIWEAVRSLLTTDAPIIRGIRETIGVPDFIEPADASWGFGPKMHLNDELPDAVEWRCPMPDTGLKDKAYWTNANATILTLSTLLSALQLQDLPDDAPDTTPLQLMTVDLYYAPRSLGAYPLGGAFAPAVVDWMRAHAPEPPNVLFLDEVEAIMRSTFERVIGSTYRDERFTAMIDRPHRLYLECPGDACDIASSYDDEPAGYGTEFHCHNVDNPAQQLSFLMGLAKFHEILRREGV